MKNFYNILIVEDSKFVNDNLKEYLFSTKEFKFNIYQAFSITEAKNILETQKFDFIILDLTLPDGIGEDLIKDIKAKSKAKVIVLTSDDNSTRRKKLYTLGILDYFSKKTPLPYISKEIVECIRRYESNNQLKILVVDDNKLSRDSIKNIFINRNYVLLLAYDGAEAIDIISHTKVDCMVLNIDIKGKITGEQVLYNLRNNKKSTIDLPIITISAINNENSIAQVLKSGANEYLTKPYSTEELVYKTEVAIDLYTTQIQLLKNNEKLIDSVNDKAQKLQSSLDLIDKYVIKSETDINGTIVSVSEAFCKISGYTKEELVGKSHNIVRHPDMPSSMFKYLWDTITRGEIWQGDIQNLTKDGNSYWVYSTISPKFDNDGKIVGFISIRQNITDKKIAEEHQSQMLQQSRHAAMGEMIGMIAHQWRQPLSTIASISNSVILSIELGECVKDNVNHSMREIGEYAQHLSNTVNDFRNFFKPNKKRTITSSKALVGSSIKFINHLLKNNAIELKNYTTLTENIFTFENEVIQVLINIIKNSCDELIERGTKNRYILIKDYEDEKNIYIEISDNAGGIDDKIINKIFEPYFSTKSKNGTGLGLYMSKIIIEEHLKGKLSAFNNEDGAVFKICMPKVDNE